MSGGRGIRSRSRAAEAPAGPDDAEDRLLLLEDAPRRVQIGPCPRSAQSDPLCDSVDTASCVAEPEGSEREGCGDADLEAHRWSPRDAARTTIGRSITA